MNKQKLQQIIDLFNDNDDIQLNDFIREYKDTEAQIICHELKKTVHKLVELGTSETVNFDLAVDAGRNIIVAILSCDPKQGDITANTIGALIHVEKNTANLITLNYVDRDRTDFLLLYQTVDFAMTARRIQEHKDKLKRIKGSEKHDTKNNISWFK